MPDQRTAFSGSVPQIACRELTGFDCPRLVSPDGPDCGDPTHAIRTRPLPDLPEGFSPAEVSPGVARKPRLVVNEDYDLVVDGVELTAGVQPNDLHITRTALEQFTVHHGVADEVARVELRFFVATMVERSRVEVNAGGFHVLAASGIKAVVSPDGRTITNYATRHYERMPSEVLTGAPSRFGNRNRVPRVVHTCPDDDLHPGEAGDEDLGLVMVRELLEAGRARVSDRVLSLFGRAMGPVGDRDALLLCLRSELAEASRCGAWGMSNRGGHTVEHRDRGWIIREADGVVVAMFQTDPTPSVVTPTTAISTDTSR